MKIKYIQPLILGVILLGTSRADTIILKSGAKLEGTVLSEDRTHYTVSVRYTANISDKRRIAKSEVKEIIRTAKDKAAFKSIKDLVPVADRSPASLYPSRIKKVEAFLKDFPKSKQAPVATKMLATLRAEHKAISSGGVKFDGQLLSPNDIEANAYDIHARYLLEDMKKLAAANRSSNALRKWDTLQSDYKNSQAFADGLPLAEKIVDRFLLEMTDALSTFDERTKKRKADLDLLSQNDRQRTLDFYEESRANHEKLIEKEEKVMKTKWLTVDTFHKPTLEYNKRSAVSAKSQFRNLTAKKIPLAGDHFRGTWTALAADDLTAAAKHFAALKPLNLPARYTEAFGKELAEKQVIAKAASEKAEKERRAAVKAAKAAAAKREREAAEAKKKQKGKKGSSNTKTPPATKPAQ